jgi:periplasmic protein TonB
MGAHPLNRVPESRVLLGSNMVETEPRTAPSEPELNLLLPKGSEQSVFKSLFQNLDDFFFPKKLPPLVLTSKPIPVRDIWGFYNNKKNGWMGSVIAHVVLFTALIVVTILGRRIVKQIVKPTETVTYTVSPTPILKPSKTVVAGGGGGGDRDKFQAPKGKLPKLDMQQITPPMMVVRNQAPKLTAPPTIVVPPQVKVAINNMPNLGNPMAAIPSGPPSNGVGANGGIGNGGGNGIGSGEGPGFGPGRGGGTGGDVFRVGGGVSAPKAIYAPDPEYSEEARKAKWQGTCELALVVGPDGRTSNIKVVRTLGLGLDQKAVEAVKSWKFEPAMKDGRPVAVAVTVDVEFHLY